MTADGRDRARLTSDEWRRICAVLDRLHDARPESRDTMLENACREQGLAVEDVRPFVDAKDRSEALPEEIPLEVIASALDDIAQETTVFRLDAGQKLGPYQIVGSLGAGGMGEVYRANDTRLDRTVAVKVLRPHLLQSAEARQQFDREARAISRLNHPHVCTLYDVGHEDGVDFLVMEYVEGETLARRLQRGAIPVAQAIGLGSQKLRLNRWFVATTSSAVSLSAFEHVERQLDASRLRSQCVRLAADATRTAAGARRLESGGVEGCGSSELHR